MFTEKKKNVKDKIDDVLSKKKDKVKDADETEVEKATVWSPFAKKIYTDMKLYIDSLEGASPTRLVATKFRNDIDDKLEDGKEKTSVINYFNKKFKLNGVSSKPWTYYL